MPLISTMAFLLASFALPHFVFASVVLPGDGPYYRLNRDHTQYIYDPEAREIVHHLDSYHGVFRKMYDQSFGWRLDERQDLILLSSRQQVTNAYATIIPNIKSVWYPSGGAFLEDSAASSWALILDAHETAHLYQLNAKADLPAAVTKVVGNSLMPFFFFWPIFLHPNAFTPTFLVEGNAVLNESRINMGGRLHSGEARALVLAQIKAGDIDPARLINDQFRFPFGQVAYLQGGYFQAHLASKYGIEKTNQFFRAQAEHYLWPLILNQTFRDHFGASYPQEIREYVRGLEGLAQQQKENPAPPLVKNTFLGPMNHDEKKIWLLAHDGKAPADLVEFDKATKSLTRRRLDLPTGKVFFDGFTPLAVSTQKHDLHHIEYSLYGEGERFDPRWRGQIVNDIRAGKTAGLAAGGSWLETRLFLDGEPYDIAHSSAVLDKDGNVYYFRQNGAERIMYKNREPLFKIDGFYGKPTEVDDDGAVFFIGNTDYGSSLYAFYRGEIFRVVDSDRVVDARQISQTEYLIAEVDHEGHKVSIAASTLRSGAPVTYAYGFATENVIPEPALSREQVEADDREYNAFRDLRYSALETAWTYAPTPGFGLGLNARFVDPLEYHAFDLGYSGTQFRDQAMGAQYTLTKYLIDWVIAYRYKEEWWERTDGTDQKAYNQDVATGMVFPILRWRRWDANVGLLATYSLEDRRNRSGLVAPDNEETYGSKSYFNLRYQNAPPIGLFSWREFSLSAVNRLESRPNKWKTRYNTSAVNLKYQHGFKNESYLTGFATAAWAINRDIDVEYGEFGSDIVIPLLTSHEDYVVKTAERARVEFHKVFRTPAYAVRFPISIERLAPFGVFQAAWLDDDSRNLYPHHIIEWGYGVDIQFLLLHRMPAVLRYMNAFNVTNPASPENQLRFSLKQEF